MFILRNWYYQMLRIRMVEEKLTEWYKAKLIKAPVHLSIGQEAVAVGIMSALTSEDKIVSTHRCHGHYLAKGGDLKAMMAEILGKKTGCCKGKGGTMHLFDDEVGHVISAPLVGGSIPFAVGLALSAKLKKISRVSVAFFGDGAVEEGIFWESLNFAATHRLPVVFVCENNLYATHSPILRRQPGNRISPRVVPHLSENVFCIENANDVWEVSKIAETAVKNAEMGRSGFIEACTYRWREHWGVGEDWDMGYRTFEEGKKWMDQCPLKIVKKYMDDCGDPLSNLEISDMTESIKKEIEEAARFAFNSPNPDLDDMFTEVEE